jgi:pimeloyl-ACP methyl ester carboxylesterase
VPATVFEQRDLRVGGTRLRYIDEGPRNAPVVLILPGHTSRIEEYDALVPRLAERFRVLVFDFPGTGYSEKPEHEYTIRLYEDTVIAFMDALRIVRAHLAGGSLGANVLLGVASRHPERFNRLVPWSPGSAWPGRPQLARAGRLLVAGYLPFVFTVRVQSLYWYRDDFPGRAEALRRTFDYYDEVMSPGFVAMYWGLALDTLERSLFDIAAHVPHPTLLCYGGLDATPYMQEGVQRLYELLPRHERCFFPNASHALATEVPDALVERVREFLTRDESELPAAPIRGQPES